jgi:AcrR family transcriptional regulator
VNEMGEHMNSEKRMTSRRLQAIERKQQLLDAAKKLFAKNGYHNTSVRSITKSIGMADGLIYHYFPKGKLEILHTIFKEGYEGLSERVNKILDSITDEMTLNKVMIYCCKALRNTDIVDNELINIIFREKNLLEKEYNELFLHTFSKFWSMIYNILRKRAEQGEIKQLDFEMATHQFMTTVTSTIIMKNLPDKIEDSIDIYIERLVEFTLSSWKN